MNGRVFCFLMSVGVALVLVVEMHCLSQSTAMAAGPIQVSSASFQQEGMIPKKFTCSGRNISPPLAWSGVPKEAKSIALIMDDPDAPGRTYVHWVVFNMPPQATGLPENVSRGKTIPGGGQQGITTNRKNGYLGPCPPSGTHRYYIKLYALDTMLKLKSGATKSQLLKAMEGHVIAQGQLMGKYKK